MLRSAYHNRLMTCRSERTKDSAVCIARDGWLYENIPFSPCYNKREVVFVGGLSVVLSLAAVHMYI